MYNQQIYLLIVVIQVLNYIILGIKSPHLNKKIKLISNHIPNNCIIGSKKILWMLM
jgi:hypothetical protein